MRITHTLVAVATALLQRPQERHWGYDLTRVAGVRSGSLYPLLRRLLEAGWLNDGWESDEEVVGRPPRRYYELTEKGMRELGAVVAQAAMDRRFSQDTGDLRWTP